MFLVATIPEDATNISLCQKGIYYFPPNSCGQSQGLFRGSIMLGLWVSILGISFIFQHATDSQAVTDMFQLHHAFPSIPQTGRIEALQENLLQYPFCQKAKYYPEAPWRFPLTSRWPELSHRTTTNCRGSGENKYSAKEVMAVT